ncbi:probable tocopherol cyclase, chloroplastic [Physcomitrium patens]|uniref:Tocopherol cyclase n=2 Tax=Physcomitrium patens TaxID=3218 RepID=A0A2K1K9S0_PHYPA|nr:probable tocopherol cyclase, chloroplastic [Physcomitrium patens]PNR50519.1 hypothetical protein PHYPA_009705 [Physcomitrium patens]|eukprot:XP_024381013.1 probable tocopherol cyclase, chloroplastic [Physcomitrella patens]
MAMSMTIACTGVLGRVAVYAPSRRGCVVKAESSAENNPVTGTSTPEGNALKDRVKSKQTAAAVYTPTLADRDTRTPHSGYHFDGTSRRFFEGWYFKVSIPEVKQSFAWMYSVEDPSVGSNSSASSLPFGELFQGMSFPGVGAQIMGADDKYLLQFDENVTKFWGSRHELALGYTFTPKGRVSPPMGEVNPQEFVNRVEEGFQVTPTWHQGCLRDNGKTDYAETVPIARWEYSTRPIYGWGDSGAEQKSTAGWLAALPVFEPHWQVCMAGGLSTGWIEWDGQRYEFEDAPSYSEKNWGGSFPLKWFWIQCNVFEGVSGEVALTAGGGRRGLPLVPGAYEEVAMVGIHYDGKFYEFVPWEGSVEWDISTWGSWKMSAKRDDYEVNLEATCDSPGCTLRAPTADLGLAPMCRDSFFGKLKLTIRNRSSGKMILDTTSDMCALEVGGGPWYNSWKTSARVQEPLKSLLRYSIDVERVFSPVPQLKPPGL